MNRADPNWAHFWKKNISQMIVVSKMSRDPWFDCPTCNSNLEWNLVFVCWPYYHRVDFLNRIYSLFCVTFEYVRRNRWYRNSITCQRKRKRILMHQLSWCVCRGRAVGTWRGGGDIAPPRFWHISLPYTNREEGGRCEITPPHGFFDLPTALKGIKRRSSEEAHSHSQPDFWHQPYIQCM